MRCPSLSYCNSRVILALLLFGELISTSVIHSLQYVQVWTVDVITHCQMSTFQDERRDKIDDVAALTIYLTSAAWTKNSQISRQLFLWLGLWMLMPERSDSSLKAGPYQGHGNAELVTPCFHAEWHDRWVSVSGAPIYRARCTQMEASVKRCSLYTFMCFGVISTVLFYSSRRLTKMSKLICAHLLPAYTANVSTLASSKLPAQPILSRCDEVPDVTASDCMCRLRIAAFSRLQYNPQISILFREITYTTLAVSALDILHCSNVSLQHCEHSLEGLCLFCSTHHSH